MLIDGNDDSKNRKHFDTKTKIATLSFQLAEVKNLSFVYI